MKKILIFFIFLFLLPPTAALAQTQTNEGTVFEARVLEILKERNFTDPDGANFKQQDIKLKGLYGEWKDKEFNFYGISDLELTSANAYKKGDTVLVNTAEDASGNDVFYILDYVRRGNLYLLAFIFALVVVGIGKWRGVKALASLIISFVIIIKFIIPQILAGANPLLIGIAGSFLILLFIIYLTEGFNKKSHLAIASICIALLLTGGLAILFTELARLTGRAEEEVMYLMGAGKGIDFRGLLLAGILIGVLGILDDMVISQVETAYQIKEADPRLKRNEIFKKALEVGKSHLGAIINTLFLAYASASLPFLLLFSASSSMTFSQIINSEIIATEIIRTLVGSIGIALAMPITTFVAAHYYSREK